MQFVTRYKGRKSVPFKTTGKPRTHQSFKQECDINNIMKKYMKNGVLPELIKRDPRYGDFSNVPDYQTSLETVQMAHDQFNALSAKVRERFNNDPANFLAFVHDDKNIDEMIKLGLASRRENPPQALPEGVSEGKPKLEQ